MFAIVFQSDGIMAILKGGSPTYGPKRLRTIIPNAGFNRFLENHGGLILEDVRSVVHTGGLFRKFHVRRPVPDDMHLATVMTR